MESPLPLFNVDITRFLFDTLTFFVLSDIILKQVKEEMK